MPDISVPLYKNKIYFLLLIQLYIQFATDNTYGPDTYDSNGIFAPFFVTFPWEL